MRRLLMGLTIGALLFGAGFAGAKIATVTNPMTADLDAGGYRIANASNFTSMFGDYLGTGMVQTGQVQLFQVMPGGGGAKAVIVTGSTAPNAPCEFAYPSSLWLQTDAAGNGHLWVKTGPGNCDWTPVA